MMRHAMRYSQSVRVVPCRATAGDTGGGIEAGDDCAGIGAALALPAVIRPS